MVKRVIVVSVLLIGASIAAAGGTGIGVLDDSQSPFTEEDDGPDTVGADDAEATGNSTENESTIHYPPTHEEGAFDDIRDPDDPGATYILYNASTGQVVESEESGAHEYFQSKNRSELEQLPQYRPNESIIILSSEDVESKFHTQVQELRESVGKDPLEYNPYLASTARAHSQDMYQRDFTEHENPDGEMPWDRIQRGGPVECGGYGENLARFSYTSLDDNNRTGGLDMANIALRGFENSPPHYELMITDTGHMDEVGTGVYFGPENFYITVNFCKYADTTSDS